MHVRGGLDIMSPYVIKKRKASHRKKGDDLKKISRSGRSGRWGLFSAGILAILCGFGLFIILTNQVFPDYSGEMDAWEDQWRPLFQGIDYTGAQLADPRPLHIHALRIDLNEPGVHVAVTPSNGLEPGEVFTQTTSRFLEKANCQVAVNASLFAPESKSSGKPVDILGLSISNGSTYSLITPNLHAIGWTRDQQVYFGRPDFPEGVEIYNGVGGLLSVLIDGDVPTESDHLLQPRTIAGASQDGKTLFLVVIDGRQPGFSEGMTTIESGHLMMRLGAWNAINLDGGGSSTMAIENDFGRGVVVNRPPSPYLRGIQRPVANHIGVYAQRLP